MIFAARPPPPPGTIIERPDLQTLAQRLGGYTFTFFGWAIYLYLWLPLVTLLAWWLDLGFVYEQMVDQDGLRALSEVARWYFVVFGCLGLSYLGWARYNQWRFRGKERRGPRPQVPLERIAEDFGVPVKVLEQWRTQRRTVIHLDESARVVPSPLVLAKLRPLPSGPDAGEESSGPGLGPPGMARSAGRSAARQQQHDL